MEGRQKSFYPFHKRLLNHLVCIFFLVISTSAESFRSKLNYSDVHHLGNSCPVLDSCMYKRTMGSRDLDSPRERNCACDYMCEEYSDCCIDAPPFLSVETSEMKRDWKCYELRQFGGVYMKDKCLGRFSNPELISLCENIDREDFSDPLVTMPVTDSSNGLTYRNLYCAMCNGKNDTLVLWTPRLECPTLTIYNSSRKNLTHEYVFQNLIFDGESWGLYLDGDNGSLFFHDCVIDPVMPRLLESKIRLCKIESVSECAKDWKDEEVKAKCAAYAGLRYYHSESYRNVHCAMCNRVNISLLTCQPVEYREMFIFRTFEHRAFSLLLDINEQKGQDVGMVQRCGEDELFDPFFKKCRSFGCLPGTIKKGGDCVPKDETSTAVGHSGPDLESLDIVDPFDILQTNVMGTNPSHIMDEEGTRINSSIHHSQIKPPYIDNDTGMSYNTSMLDNYSQLEKEVGIFKNCLLISLRAEDYIMFENKTIYVPEYDKLYEPTNYFAADGSVLICSHFDSAQEIKFTNIMGYVTVVGLGVSMLCLFLHFVVFCIVPDLRNLSGKNLVSQCVALFCAYCSYIAGQNQLGAQVCTAVAFLTIYFFQASFFWMSSMAFDVWRTLKMATTELRVSSGKQWKRFIAYSAYSWLFPLFIVGLAALAEYSDIFPEEYRPRFAQPQCWFKHRRALLCFFAAPLFSVIFSNIILFASSAKMIIITTKTTIKQQNPSQKRNFKLYLRLFILMGLTWGVGLVAGYVDIEILWYFFIILNTLQGLFIFISFSCSSKVLNYLRDQFKFTQTTEYRSSASHSTSHSGCNTNSTTALTSVSIKPTSRLWLLKKHSASPTNSSASNSSRH